METLQSEASLPNIIKQITGALKEIQPPAGGIDVRELLKMLASEETSSLDAKHWQAIHMLCRKIGVVGKVHSAYSSNWKKCKASEPLASEYWRLLIAVLLLHSQAALNLTNDQFLGDYSNRGTALKMLNAALKAIDLAAEQYGSSRELDGLKKIACELLDLMCRN